MKRWKWLSKPMTWWMAGLAGLFSLLYVGVSHAQQAQGERYITMSEKIGAIVVLYQAFDVWIYVFQGILLFMGIGYTIFYLNKFRKPEFVQQLRARTEKMEIEGNLHGAIDFEIESQMNKFMIVEMMISAAPIAGLLGTVVGLVQVFDQQTKVDHVTMQAIAGGMYVAMVTTVCGLIVAIFGVVGRHFLMTRLAEIRETLAGVK